MELALTIAHLIFAVILIIVVLFQKGKQPGLSGAVAGGADTFFGKNKGRTVDSILKKLTSVFAILFIVTSLALAFVATQPAEAPAAEAPEVQVENENVEIPVETEGEAVVEPEAETEAE